MINSLWDILISLILFERNGGGSEAYNIRCRMVQTLCEHTEYNMAALMRQIDNIVKNAMEYYNCDIEKQQEINNKILADLIDLKDLYMLAFDIKIKNAE